MKGHAATRHTGDFVEDVIACIQKRSRSIKHRGAKIESERVKEIEGGAHSDIERLDLHISYRVAASKVTFRLRVWGDRWVWGDIRRRGKSGWAWSATFEGR